MLMRSYQQSPWPKNLDSEMLPEIVPAIAMAKKLDSEMLPEIVPAIAIANLPSAIGPR
jgi:hypothetical protein